MPVYRDLGLAISRSWELGSENQIPAPIQFSDPCSQYILRPNPLVPSFLKWPIPGPSKRASASSYSLKA